MAWATITETLTYTGISVGQDNIDAAQAMIEIFADVTEDCTSLSSKNLRMLKMAVAYQAAWISDHPDVFTHVDVSTMLQDGLQFTNAHANAGVLAPMAKRALDRLSWRRNRSIKIRTKRQSLYKRTYQFNEQGGVSGGAFDSTDIVADDLPWESM